MGRSRNSLFCMNKNVLHEKQQSLYASIREKPLFLLTQKELEYAIKQVIEANPLELDDEDDKDSLPGCIGTLTPLPYYDCMTCPYLRECYSTYRGMEGGTI